MTNEEKIMDALYRSYQLLGSEEYAIFSYYRSLAEQMRKDDVKVGEINDGELFSKGGKYKNKGVANRNTKRLGQPTTNNGNPPVVLLGAKLNKNYENAIDDIINFINEKRTLGAHEFLHELDNAMTGINKESIDKSDYIDVGDGYTVRISDHYSNANTFNRFNNTTNNYGIVIKLENQKFKSDPNVDYVEYVYFPDKLDRSRQLAILEGVKSLIKTKDIGQLPKPDNVHKSKIVKDDIIKELISKGEITFTDEQGNPCAACGMGGVKGTKWEIVKDFNGMPKHSQGGVDIMLTDNGVRIIRDGGEIECKNGLFINSYEE